MLQRAFDLGITHFDLANNYGPPSMDRRRRRLGRFSRRIFSPYRDELIISDEGGMGYVARAVRGFLARGKYMLASLDQSLEAHGAGVCRRIFYHHRSDPDTPGMEESMGALDTAVRSGKALYAGISA